MKIAFLVKKKSNKIIQFISGNKRLPVIFFSFPVISGILIYIFRQTWPAEIILSFLPYLLVFYLFFLVIFATISFWKKLRIDHYKPLFFTNILIIIFYLTLLFPAPSAFTNLSVSDQNLKIMSVNIYAGNTDYEQISKLIKEENPDIMILIELTNQIYGKIKDTINLNYPYKSKISQFFGYNQIFSKYPIIDSVNINADNENIGYLKAEISAKNKTYTVYAVHTAAPADYHYFTLRNQYLHTLAQDIFNETSGNLIVAGDFNVSPWSYYYGKFQEETDNKITNISLLNSFSLTWTLLPEIPLISSHLDHIFLGQNIAAAKFYTRDLAGSDHDALISILY